jgi:hypothetical protein
MFIPPEEHVPDRGQGRGGRRPRRRQGDAGAHGQLQGSARTGAVALAGAGQMNGTRAMTPIDALRAATIVSAEKIGFGQDLGSVDAGKLADLVVLDADPLADIANSQQIKWVVKNGELFDAETLRAEWPKEKPLPPFFWRDRRTTTSSTHQ